MKPLILCADDYGVSKPVGEAIRELLGARRLSAVSCMSSGPEWPAEAARLQPFRGTIDVGLHLNLTLGFGTAVTGLKDWIVNCLTGRIDRTAVGRVLRRQFELFESAWGAPPDFVDGHQHVHVFPGIRTAVLQLLVERYPERQRPWIRRVDPPLTGHDAPLKVVALRILASGFAGAVRRSGLALSDGFDGLYSLSDKADYPALMTGWLRRARPGTLLMCHPGLDYRLDPEGIGRARMREFLYLRSSEFGDLLRREDIVLERFRCRDGTY